MIKSNSSFLSSSLRLRLLIGFLGERAQFGWWPTAFFDPSSRHFIEPIFARSPRLAQYHGVLEAARRLHDERLNVGSYHLFRLPEELEQDLHLLVQTRQKELSHDSPPRDKQSAMTELFDIAQNKSRDSVGPISIGRVSDIADHLKEIAAVYYTAFSSSSQSFPYLTR